MANNSLADSSSGLNPLFSFSCEQLSNEALRERLFVLLEQLDALVHMAAHAELHEQPGSVVYCYLTVVDDHLRALKATCEWLVRRVLPEPAEANAGKTT